MDIMLLFQDTHWRKTIQMQVLLVLCLAKSHSGKTPEDAF